MPLQVPFGDFGLGAKGVPVFLAVGPKNLSGN
jgi:hypothetical protein